MALAAVGSSGGTSGSNGYSISWTLGEAATLNGLQGDLYVGAGFQQARKRSTTVGVFSIFIPSMEINVYPNPASELLTIEAASTELNLRLCDLLGREVISSQRMNGVGQLDLSHLPAGTYVLLAFDENGLLAAAAKIQHLDN